METLSHTEIIKLLLQLSIILISGRLMAEVARKFKLPAVVGEIIAGIILGPTIFGRFLPVQFDELFPSLGPSMLVLDGFVRISVVLLLFIAGLEVQLSIVLQQGKQALYTSFFGLVIPFGLGFIIPFYYPEFFGMQPQADRLIFSLFVGTAMSISALSVIARILMDLDMFRTRMGMLIIASAMLDDITGWLIFSVIISMIGISGEGFSLPVTILLTVGFATFMLTFGRGLINWALPHVNRKFSWPGGLLSLSLGFCFIAAALTEFIGIHAVFGAFIFGIALGDSEHMPERAKEIMHQFVNNIFAPIFFVSVGLKMNFITNFDPFLILVVLLIAFTGKVVGCGFGTYLGGYSLRESLAVGFGMNARGSMEIILGLIALENHIINENFFIALVSVTLVTSITSGPFMRMFLKPAKIKSIS